MQDGTAPRLLRIVLPRRHPKAENQRSAKRTRKKRSAPSPPAKKALTDRRLSSEARALIPSVPQILLRALDDVELVRWLERDNPGRDAVGASSRVLRALLVANVRGDAEAICELERAAKKLSVKMRVDRVAEAAESRELIYTEMQRLGTLSSASRAAIQIVDPHAERNTTGRADYVRAAASALERCACAAALGNPSRKADRVHATAELFVELACSLHALPILTEREIGILDKAAALQVVEASYKKLKPWTDRTRRSLKELRFGHTARLAASGSKTSPDGERLLVAGYRALGLRKQDAEALKDSIRQRETRQPRNAK